MICFMLDQTYQQPTDKNYSSAAIAGLVCLHLSIGFEFECLYFQKIVKVSIR